VSKEYKISTLQDCLQIPWEKWFVFVGELVVMLSKAREAKLADPEAEFILPITWIDDDKGEIKFNIYPHEAGHGQG